MKMKHLHVIVMIAWAAALCIEKKKTSADVLLEICFWASVFMLHLLS